MVAPFTDLRDADAENLIYLVSSGFTTRPTLPASLLISAGRLLVNYQNIMAYPQICVSLFKIVRLCSRIFSALWRTRLNNVADKPSPCLTPLLMTKGLLIFPCTIIVPWAPSHVIFTSRSIFLGIPKLTSDSSSFFFWFILSKVFIKSMKTWWSVSCA